MADGNLIDLYRDKHREFLNSIDRVWVSYDKSSDRLTLLFRANDRLPANWLKSLRIEIYHEHFGVQETASDVEWVDVQGSMLTVRCARPKRLLRDGDAALQGEELLPIGDVILFAGEGAHEHPLYNEFGQRVMSHQFDPFHPRRRGREDEMLPR